MANATDPRTNGITLLPCPFCGCEEIDEYEGEYGNGVYCMNCGAMIGEQIHREFHVHERVEYEQAAEAWNTRVAVTDHGFAMSVHDGKLWGKCSECGDAIELANVRTMLEDTLKSNDELRERIAELCAEINEEAAGRIERDALIRDMFDVAARGEFDVGKEADFAERMRELGIEVDA